MEKIFPSEFSEIGRALLDGDYALIENRRVLLTRVRDYVAGLSDGSTVGSPWEAIIAAQLAADTAQLAADTAQLAADTAQGSANNAQADADALDSRVTALEAGSGGVVLAEWNGTDLTQFAESGDPNWTTQVGAYGPAGEAAIKWTTTAAGGLKERYLVFDPGVVLPAMYTVDFFLGPYTGNTAPTRKVMVKPMCHYVDATHFIGVAPQGDNAGGANALNSQTMVANGGGASYNNFGTGVYPGAGFPAGRVRFHVYKAAGEVAAAARLWGGYTRVSASYANGAGDKVGLYIVHFAQAQSIGDSSYCYGLRIYDGHI